MQKPILNTINSPKELRLLNPKDLPKLAKELREFIIDIVAQLTAIFLIAEITSGHELFVPLIIISAISFALTKHYISHSIYTMKLAERGELMTHDKDQNTLMVLKIDKIIETNFVILKPEFQKKTIN